MLSFLSARLVSCHHSGYQLLYRYSFSFFPPLNISFFTFISSSFCHLPAPQIVTAHSSSSTSACQYTECLYFSINNLSLNSSILYCCSCCLSVTVFVCVCVYELMFSLFVVVVERHFVEENPVRVFVSFFFTQFSLF